MDQLHNKLNAIIRRVTDFKIDPAFSVEIKRREENRPPQAISNSELLEVFVQLIAFSQQAISKKVKILIDEKVFAEILAEYDAEKVAAMNPCDLAEKHFARVSGIRQQAKFFHIVMFSRLIKRDATVLQLLTNPPLPKIINTESDIQDFWKGFKLLQAKMKSAKAPFLRETTTLLHFLMELGYDCIKPDSAVMKASNKIGIVNSLKGNKNFIQTVKAVQNFALQEKIRPGVIDLYLLIEGKQTDASMLVRDEFYH